MKNAEATSVSMPLALSKSRLRLLASTARYLLGRAALVAVTVFFGVYATILIVGQPTRSGLTPAKSPFEVSLEQQIERYLRANYLGQASDQEIEVVRAQLRSEAGLDLPYLIRQVLWTYKALTFDWGRLTVISVATLGFGRTPIEGARDIVLQYLPNTLLLIGTSYLLVFVLGIPLSLYLARHHGRGLDALMSLVWPLSSVPSWVIGVLLVALFAVQLRWLPVGGMFDTHKPEEPIQYVLVLGKHMLLPVSALVLGLLLQLVYTWRAFFAAHAGEDYVELAKAKGLPKGLLENRYILRPTLPYVITSFSLTLIGFWQMSMVLEVVFQWPGLGWLYITKALPNFWGDSIYPGELIVAVGIVVIFAYVLGIVVFLLDLVYAIVDPRIHLMPSSAAAISSTPVSSRRWSLGGWLARWRRSAGVKEQPPRPQALVRHASRESPWQAARLAIASWGQRMAPAWREFRRDPGAMLALVILAGLGIGAVIAITAYPYTRIGTLWGGERLSGRAYVPRLASPEWVSLIVDSGQLSTLILDEQSQATSILPSGLSPGWIEKTTVLSFDYPYRESPTEIYLYLDATYAQKPPFVSVQWIYPDGRRLALRGTTAAGSVSYDFDQGLNLAQFVSLFPEQRAGLQVGPGGSLPVPRMLFGESWDGSSGPLQGKYQVVIKSLMFEAESDVKAQLVLLGSVYGAAGTDYWRRDLTVPLLWGMPFALVFGLAGAGAASLLAMLAAAAGTWLGGWVDATVQRFTDISMILPLLAIGVLASALWNINLWLIIGLIIFLTAFGAPVKTFRSAFLQIKEAPYVEAARAYGASDARIITGYLVPRILPVLIPQLVVLVPSFVFLEATLGLFNIRSVFPSWGTVISEALSKGALYGSRFWVLEPISLVLLTSLAFALMGSALERIFNPRLALTSGGEASKAVLARGLRPPAPWTQSQAILRSPALLSLLMLCLLAVLILAQSGKTAPVGVASEGALVPGGIGVGVNQATVPAEATTPSELPTQLVPGDIAPPAPAASQEVIASQQPDGASTVAWPTIYRLRRGEYPYCIARRFNLDPTELLALNHLLGDSHFHAGADLLLPQTGHPFPAERSLKPHPAIYTITETGTTLQSVACEYGDVDPQAIARANGLSEEAELLVGTQILIP